VTEHDQSYDDIVSPWIDVYQRYTARWQNAKVEHYMPPMATRLLALRARWDLGMDYGTFVRTISCNLAETQRLVLKEIATRHTILMNLVERQSDIITDDDRREIVNCLNEELAVAHSPEGQQRLRLFLERLTRFYWHHETTTQRGRLN